MEHVFNAKGLCSNCGCSGRAIAHFGWKCVNRHKMPEEDYQAIQEKVEQPPVTEADMDMDELKLMMSKLPEPDFWLFKLLSKDTAKGYVVWDSSPPKDYSWQTHKLTFWDAVQVGLRFLRTDCFDEWIVCGPTSLAIVRTLPEFVENPKRPECGALINYVGTLRRMDVYAYPSMVEYQEFWVGRNGEAVVGKIEGHG
jgi:hypothetical protein